MNLFIFLTFSALVSYASCVHNGEVVEPNSIPYEVLLLVHSGDETKKCGGSLIKEDRVLTAAHCVKDRDYVEVIVGAHYLHDRREETRQSQKVDSSYLYPHPLWEPGKSNDVGIIKLPEPFELNEYVSLIKLPYGLEGHSFVGETGKISGWGEIDENPNDHVGPLRFIENPIISNDECRRRHVRTDSGNLCLSGQGARRVCPGDSGSPLVIKHKGELIQVGVTSKEIGKCDSAHPSVFTRVTHYLDGFIKNNS